MLTLWGEATAPSFLKAIWTLEELGLPYRRGDGLPDMSVATAGCSYSAVGGHRPTVCLQDDKFTLCEGHSIIRYLCNAHGQNSTLYPADPRTRADIDAWLDYQVTAMETPALAALESLGRLKTGGVLATSASLQEWKAQWRALESRLARHRFIVGGQITLADIAFGPLLHRWFALPIPGQRAMPHVRAWYDMLMTRPTYRTHVAIPIIQTQWVPTSASARPSRAATHWFRYDSNSKMLTVPATPHVIHLPA